MWEKLRTRIEEIRWEEAANPSRWVRFARRQVRLYFYIVRELIRNRCPQQAAALTFTTLLSLVPLFAVAFSFFRGFAALEGVEDKVQDAIFRSVLAEPLVDRRTPVAGRAEPEELPAEKLRSMSARELLAFADGRPRHAAVGTTLGLYVRALNNGAPAGSVRRGMATLYLTRADSLHEQFGRLTGQAQNAYFRAAGIQRDPIRAEPRRLQSARTSFQKALSLYQAGDYRGTLTALAAAEDAGSTPVRTRELAARARAGLVRAGGVEQEGVTEHYRQALFSLMDAAMLAARSGGMEELKALTERHDQVLGDLGDHLLLRGREFAEAYLGGEEEANSRQEEAAEAAIDHLKEAARLLPHSSEVHRLLGNLYAETGRQEGALRSYRAALEESHAAAARGISVAVGDYIRRFIDKVGRAEIGLVGVMVLLVTATSLLSTIEKTLNHIWKVSERRPFWIKFTSYCTLIWLGPALVGASIWIQERLGGYIARYLGQAAVIGPLVQGATRVGQWVLPFLMTWLVLVALYKFLPNTHARFYSVAWGAFLGALLLQGARPLYSLYVTNAVRYQRIYGSLGAVPLFLLWIWLLWLIVLFGAEVAFTVQNVDLLQYRDRMQRLSRVFIDRYLAARIMLYVAREFWESGEPVSAAQLGQILQIAPEEASDAANRLVKLGLLTPVGEERDRYHPARDLSRLRVSEVLSITDRFRSEFRSGRPQDSPYERQLDKVFQAVIQAQDGALEDMTLRDLLERAEGSGED